MKPVYAAITNPVLDQTNPEAGGSTFALQLAAIWRTSIVIGALLLIMYLLWGAIAWITAGGDKAKVEQARNQLTHAVVGFAILAGTVALVTFIGSALKIDFLQTLQFDLPSVGQ